MRWTLGQAEAGCWILENWTNFPFYFQFTLAHKQLSSSVSSVFPTKIRDPIFKDETVQWNLKTVSCWLYDHIVPLDHHWDSYKKKIWSLKLEFPWCVRFVKTASLTSIKLSTLMDTFIPLHCGKIDPALAFISTAGALYSSHKGYPPHSTPLHPYTQSNFLLKLASACSNGVITFPNNIYTGVCVMF